MRGMTMRLWARTIGPAEGFPGRTTTWLALTAALASSVPAETVAQSAGDTVTVTLEQALQIAEGSNPAYRRNVNSLGLNAVESRTTWSQVLPEARLGLFSTNFTGNLQRIGVDNLGNPVENPVTEWTFFSNTSQSLSLSWDLQGASIFNQLNRQSRTNFDRDLAVRATRTSLHTNVLRQYFEVLEQRALLALEEELADARVADFDLAEQLFRLAQASRVDLLNAELEIQQQQATLSTQIAALEQAKLALATQMGDDELGPFRVSEEPLPVFDPSELDEERLVLLANSANPTLLQAESAVASQELGVREAKTQWWPSLNLNYSVFRRRQGFDTEALFDVSPNEDLDQNLSVSISFPFFNNYFTNQQAIEQAKVGLMNEREQLRESRLQTTETVRSSLRTLENQYASLELAERQLEITEEALELARQEYRMGTRTFDELQTTIENEANARRGVISARFGFVDALLTLEEAVGTPVRGDSPVTDSGGADDGRDAAGRSEN